uniref:Uncharacterized protein n=1 Tax=Caulerpa lentillifera TaxID=148947 RepID=A0A2Z2QKJ8_9CHLO|nr:hypothetical protein [Caulerpa lentillifera]AST24262.1 hypothetical protein [Caulerpa lentillifera]
MLRFTSLGFTLRSQARASFKAPSAQERTAYNERLFWCAVTNKWLRLNDLLQEDFIIGYSNKAPSWGFEHVALAKGQHMLQAMLSLYCRFPIQYKQLESIWVVGGVYEKTSSYTQY